MLKNILNATLRDAQRNNLLRVLGDILPIGTATVLDIGTGNGELASLMQQHYPHLSFEGCEILQRGQSHIKTTFYDGKILPFADKSFDYATMINMLHHDSNPVHLLSEALRVSRKGIIIKDHIANNALDKYNLIAMEYMNPNNRDLVKMGMIFYSRAKWQEVFDSLHLQCEVYRDRFTSYNPFLDIFFGRKMHFVGRYSIKNR